MDRFIIIISSYMCSVQVFHDDENDSTIDYHQFYVFFEREKLFIQKWFIFHVTNISSKNATQRVASHQKY